MKYKVSHSLLTSPDRNFKRGEIVTAEDLVTAGFDVKFLLGAGAIEILEGTGPDTPEATPVEKKKK